MKECTTTNFWFGFFSNSNSTDEMVSSRGQSKQKSQFENWVKIEKTHKVGGIQSIICIKTCMESENINQFLWLMNANYNLLEYSHSLW